MSRDLSDRHKEVLEYIEENQPIKSSEMKKDRHPEAYCSECGQKVEGDVLDELDAILYDLMDWNYVSLDAEWRFRVVEG